jgi:hypothetical protein
MSQDMFSKIGFFEDFLAPLDDSGTAIVDADGLIWGSSVRMVAVSGDVTVDSTVDEPGGVVSFSGAGAAADGIALMSQKLCPNDGAISMGARFKYAAGADARIFVGFIETADRDETLNPATISGTTLTVNNTGETFGLSYDTGATTDDFRAIATNGTAIDSATGLGTLGARANAALTADSWNVVRVEVDQNGVARAYLGNAANDPTHSGPKLVYTLPAGYLSATAQYTPIVLLAANSTGDELMEVDYFWARGSRDWTN